MSAYGVCQWAKVVAVCQSDSGAIIWASGQCAVMAVSVLRCVWRPLEAFLPVVGEDGLHAGAAGGGESEAS